MLLLLPCLFEVFQPLDLPSLAVIFLGGVPGKGISLKALLYAMDGKSNLLLEVVFFQIDKERELSVTFVFITFSKIQVSSNFACYASIHDLKLLKDLLEYE